jgi:hypothetical protein
LMFLFKLISFILKGIASRDFRPVRFLLSYNTCWSSNCHINFSLQSKLTQRCHGELKEITENSAFHRHFWNYWANFELWNSTFFINQNGKNNHLFRLQTTQGIYLRSKIGKYLKD